MKWNKILVLILAVGVVAATVLAVARWQTESQYKTYEVTMDLEEVKKAAATDDKSLAEGLQIWKEVGMDSITITEATLDSLKWNDEYKVRTSFEGYDLVVEATEAGIDFVEKGFKEGIRGERKITRRSPTTLVIEGKASDLGVKYDVVRDYLEKKVGIGKMGHTTKLEQIGLGFIPSEIAAVKAAGLPIRFRPAYIAEVQDAEKSIARFIQAVKEHSQQSYAIFFGDTILGMDTAPDKMAEAMRDSNIAVAMIETGVQREHLEQTGLEPLVRALDYKAVRVFSTWNYIQKRYDYGMPGHHQGEEIINTFYRAITERNIRVIFFKPFITAGHDLITDYPVYKQRLTDLENRLAWHGITKASQKAEQRMEIMPILRNRPAYQMLVAFAVIACALLILDNLVPLKAMYLYVLFGLGAIPTTALYLLQIRVALWNRLFALAAVILFAVLAVQVVTSLSKTAYDKKYANSRPKAWGYGIGLLLLSTLVALLGAICEVAFYANSEHLLELGIFYGVKISQLLPLVLAFFVALRYFGNDILGTSERNAKERVLGFLNMEIKFWHAAVAAVLLGAVALLLIRSGHETGIQPANFELYVRNILEELFIARPRNKAFLFGYPAIIVLGYLAYQRRWKLLYPILGFMAAVGHANLLNTFSHIRTPLYLSLWRILFEIIFSVVMAGIYILLMEALERAFRLAKKKWWNYTA